MNRWAERNAEALSAPLADGERLLVACRVAISRRSPMRSGFPAPGRVFALGVSDQRLLLYRCSTWLARPEGFATAVPIEQVASLAPVGRLGGVRLRVELATGPVALLEPVWGGSLRQLAAAYSAVATRR